MPALLLRHRVTDYAIWKQVFEELEEVRRAYGSQGGRLFGSSADPNEIVILFEWDNLDRARLFAQSDDLRDAMTRAGVVDQPDIWFLDDADQPFVRSSLAGQPPERG